MSSTSIGTVAVIALAIGFGGGFMVRPIITGDATSLVPVRAAAPTDAEATAAVRRHKDFFGSLTGMFYTISVMTIWMIVPVFLAVQAFKRKDL